MSLVVNSDDIIQKLKELIEKINYAPVPFYRMFVRVSVYNDSIYFPAVTDIKRMRAHFTQWTTVTTGKSYMKVCISGINQIGREVDMMSKHVTNEYFAILPLTPKQDADVYCDYLGEQGEGIKSLTCLKFFIAINKASDTVDTPGYEITVNDPVLIEFEFFH